MITSPATRAFLIRLIDELEQARCSPILLRNFEKFPEEIGNDLDVYVRPERIEAAFSILDSCARALGGRIGHIHRRGYFIAIWFRFPDCEPPVHIDLYHGALTWHGLHFLDDEELVRNSQPAESGARHRIPAPYHEALISLLASILWGGYFKRRYQDRLNALLADERQHLRFTEVMQRTFGRQGEALASSIFALEASALVNDTFCRKLRQNLMVRSLKNSPLASCAVWLRHWLEELACYGWRLPGMLIEYDEQAWDQDEVEKLREKIGPYFGGIHVMDRGNASLTGVLKIRRLMGKNHLVLLQSVRFAINRKVCHSPAVKSYPGSASMAKAALDVLDERVQIQTTTR